MVLLDFVNNKQTNMYLMCIDHISPQQSLP